MSLLISTGRRSVPRVLIVNHRCFAKPVRNSDNYDALATLHPVTRDTKHGFIAQGKRALYGARDFYHDFIGTQEVRAAQQKLEDLQGQISVAEVTRSQHELELVQIRKQIAEVNASQHSVDRNDSLYYDLTKKEFLLNSEKIRLTGLLDVTIYELQVLQRQLTQAIFEMQTKQNLVAQNGRVVKILLTIVAGTLAFLGKDGYEIYRDADIRNWKNSIQSDVKELLRRTEEKPVDVPPESWASYLYRQPGRFYRYMFPSKQDQTTESWGSYLGRQPGRLYGYMFRKEK
ncbi:uncharacterized protein LOC126570250 [Anopheles aquasalis]|uniref:uncharacterized protein LOC126570250 n=1 Tax=Anopheles aquasalis TaxID=42839 RepID=UPI00215B70D6|nr:uncharacterized protein LOC126570250 [Anopheles aquasalis]